MSSRGPGSLQLGSPEWGSDQGSVGRPSAADLDSGTRPSSRCAAALVP